jgi:hypothetical protein
MVPKSRSENETEEWDEVYDGLEICPNCGLDMADNDGVDCGMGHCRWCCQEEHMWEWD